MGMVADICLRMHIKCVYALSEYITAAWFLFNHDFDLCSSFDLSDSSLFRQLAMRCMLYKCLSPDNTKVSALRCTCYR